jgi:hypothetical protein
MASCDGGRRFRSEEADLNVFAKLFENGLDRGLEAQTFSRRQIDGHDDVLDVAVGQ